jgi:hypothetical protein
MRERGKFSHVSIYSETKKKLIRVKGDLEKKTGEFYSMDGVISYLLSLSEGGEEKQDG